MVKPSEHRRRIELANNSTPNMFDDFACIFFLVGSRFNFWLSTNSNLVYYTANIQNWAAMANRSAGFRSFGAIAANAAGDAWIKLVGQGYIG
ncbi:MAG: hypothetical protein IPH20_20265 [Bacteroidales bacterium]|nr:hypothetical protein [Bacteroidales bacterium]